MSELTEEKPPELKPCPFCGSPARAYKNGHGKNIVLCQVCPSTFWFIDPEDAVAAWNRREEADG